MQPAQNFAYYRDTVYWNSFDLVQQHTNRLVTGEPFRGWVQYLGDRYPPVSCALSLNCGNGWVEREFFANRLIRSAVGIDIQTSSLGEARAEAAKLGMPARYIEMDSNNPALINIKPQWALNHAALHHVTYINRLVREVYFSLPPDGLLINYDYIGPHRNQYGREAWSKMEEIAASLPPEFRPDLRYPHLSAMLDLDPTEAVHSELILETIARYFDIEAQIPLGGALGHHLLMENRALLEQQDSERGSAIIRSIIRADVEFTRGEIGRSLFAFIVARKKRRSIGANDLLRWSREEAARNADAKRNGGRYYPATELETEFYGVNSTTPDTSIMALFEAENVPS